MQTTLIHTYFFPHSISSLFLFSMILPIFDKQSHEEYYKSFKLLLDHIDQPKFAMIQVCIERHKIDSSFCIEYLSQTIYGLYLKNEYS